MDFISLELFSHLQSPTHSNIRMSTYRFGKYTATERRNTKTQSIKTLCFSGTLAKKPIYFKCNSPKRENENTDEEKTFPFLPEVAQAVAPISKVKTSLGSTNQQPWMTTQGI